MYQITLAAREIESFRDRGTAHDFKKSLERLIGRDRGRDCVEIYKWKGRIILRCMPAQSVENFLRESWYQYGFCEMIQSFL